jgi:hypothetical protein
MSRFPYAPAAESAAKLAASIAAFRCLPTGLNASRPAIGAHCDTVDPA